MHQTHAQSKLHKALALPRVTIRMALQAAATILPSPKLVTSCSGHAHNSGDFGKHMAWSMPAGCDGFRSVRGVRQRGPRE
mmetsp:Transcript_12799/g.31946  ORF Transcript_12799/g.31946 Transcript_12799/m.31946 type:complete len:80 (-) Transcript_12799:1795-2034(-)